MTTSYDVYSRTNGQYLRTLTSRNLPPELPECEIAFDAAAGCGYLHYYCKNALAVFAMPPRPSKFHQFDYTTKQWIDPRTEQDFIDANRANRNALLLACDWTQLPDVPTTTQSAWAAYRQALRDITNQPDQTNVVWPLPPA